MLRNVFSLQGYEILRKYPKASTLLGIVLCEVRLANMIEYKINDLAFQHDKGMSQAFPPTQFNWYRGPEKVKDGNIVVFTDACLNLVHHRAYNDVKKIALLVEPYVIRPEIYRWIHADLNLAKFDRVLTHHKKMLSLSPKVMWYPNGMSWIKDDDWKPWNKSKGVSIIASEKNYAPGHQVRHHVIQQLKNEDIKIDVYGKGYRPIDNKVDALKDWRFSIAIENCQESGYFTEKLIDCFATRTVPIYWGDPSINEYFDLDGIWIANSPEDIVNHCRSLSYDVNLAEQVYKDKLPAIERNFELAKKYRCTEDFLYKNNLLIV